MLCLCVMVLFLHQLLVTTALNLTPGCRTGTASECRKATFVPGHTLLGEGVNIVTMKSTGSSLIHMQDTDKTCTLCPNPHIDNVLQKLPKAMVDWRPSPPCSRTIVSSIHRSRASLANEATLIVNSNWKTQLDVEDEENMTQVAVVGSNSDMAKFAESKGMNGKYSFISHKMQCSYYSFGLRNDPVLTHDFEQSLRKLPATYDHKSQAEYRRMISRFGTHYITQAEAGGQAQEVTAVKTCEVVMDGITVGEIKDCLDVEAELSVRGGYPSATMSEKIRSCSEKVRQGRSYHQIFNERWWQVTGGKASLNLLSAEGTDGVDKWMEVLKTRPGLVSYSLEPIHNLVGFIGPQKENLRLAISDYIKETALIKKCSCNGQASPGDDCSCSCPGTKTGKSHCCATSTGEAELSVTIKKANGLWGDYITKTDAYVKVKFDGIEERTETIWNNDNPEWDQTFDMCSVELAASKIITIEVWDEDNKHNDDLLGKCQKPVKSGESSYVCKLNHGTLTYSVSATCIAPLQGQYCENTPDPQK